MDCKMSARMKKARPPRGHAGTGYPLGDTRTGRIRSLDAVEPTGCGSLILESIGALQIGRLLKVSRNRILAPRRRLIWSASRGLLRQEFDSDPLWRDPLPRGVKQGPDLRRLVSYPCTDPRHGRAKPRGEISRYEDRASREAKRGQSSTATEFRGTSAPRRLSGSQFRQGALSSVARAQRSKKVQRSAVRVRQGPPDSSIAQHLSAKSVRLQDQTPGWQVL